MLKQDQDHALEQIPRQAYEAYRTQQIAYERQLVRFERNQSMLKKSLRWVIGAGQVEKPIPPPKFTPFSRKDIEQNFDALTKKFEIERKCPDKNPFVELERLEREKCRLEKLKKAQEPPKEKPEITKKHLAETQQKAVGRRIGIRR